MRDSPEIDFASEPALQGRMAKTKQPSTDLPPIPAVNQIMTALFSPAGADLLKAVELAGEALSQQNKAAAALFGLTLARADRDGTPVPPETEAMLQLLAENSPKGGFKLLRSSLRVTQTELAEQLGVSRSLVVNWEEGQTALPANALQALFQIAAAKTVVPPLTGNHIVRLRKFLGISRANFANALGTTETSIVNWEKRGDLPLTRNASAKVRERYANELAKAA